MSPYHDLAVAVRNAPGYDPAGALLEKTFREKDRHIAIITDALQDASQFIAYLIDHLPEDKRDNRVWLKCQRALTPTT